MRAPARITCAQCAFAESGIGARLEPEQLERFERDKTTQVLLPGQTLFCEGGPAHAVYCVRSGSFKVYKIGWRGEPLVLRFARPGSAMGLGAAVEGRPYEDTAEALEESVVCTIPIATFKECATRSPRMASAIMRRLANEVHEAHERMLELAHCDVTQRVAHLVLAMHEEQQLAAPNGAERRRPPRHTDLAAMIGTTPESLSRALHVLRERGVIEVTKDTIQVRDIAKLRAIAHVTV